MEEELHRRGLPGRPRSTGRVIGFSQPRGSAAKPWTPHVQYIAPSRFLSFKQKDRAFEGVNKLRSLVAQAGAMTKALGFQGKKPSAQLKSAAGRRRRRRRR